MSELPVIRCGCGETAGGGPAWCPLWERTVTAEHRACCRGDRGPVARDQFQRRWAAEQERRPPDGPPGRPAGHTGPGHTGLRGADPKPLPEVVRYAPPVRQWAPPPWTPPPVGPAPELEPPRVPPPGRGPRWAYGVTSCTARLTTLLPRTLASLAVAGFPDPDVFVDGPARGGDGFRLACTRTPAVRTAAHWTLSLYELYAREPRADRYALFQDDLVAVRGLREYLSALPYRPKTYWNLLTFGDNEPLADGRGPGLVRSNQRGRGAVALVFDREAVLALLGGRYLPDRLADPVRGSRSIDGGVVTALRLLGWTEMIHAPSLVQHVGAASSMGNRPHPPAKTFPGEMWDARNWLPPQPGGRDG